MWTLAFVEHSQLPPIFDQLSRDVRCGLFIPFVADDGAGKRRVLSHWAREKALIDVNKIIWSNLVSTSKKTKRKEAIASPITLNLFQRTFFSLRILKNPLLKWDEMLDREPTRVYDDERFLSLYDIVVARLKNQGIRVWIINDAHLLDTLAVEYVMKAWKECDKQFSVMLAAKRQVDQPLRDVMDNVPDTKFYTSQRPIHLKTVDEDEFCTTVLAAMFNDLRVDFAAEVERNAELLAMKAWSYTFGHWDATIRLATEFDNALGCTRGTYRRVTQQVVDQVFERLMPSPPIED